MSKFKKKTSASQDIPTSALPDIIFMLLFFFMVTTVMRDEELLVQQRIPEATQLKKLEKKSLVSYMFVGSPKPEKQTEFGSEPKIQVNDRFITPDEVILFVNKERDKLDEAERDQMFVALKVDKETKMGIVVDIQQQLKEANALKLMYSASRSDRAL